MTWTAGLLPAPTPRTDTFTGYAITCPGCGNTNALSIPCIEELQGVGQGGLVMYTHDIQCATCDGQAS